MSIDPRERLEKSQSRRATLFSALAAMSVLMCAAFADQIRIKVGVPTNMVLGMAGLGGVLILLLNLACTPDGMSRKTYGALSLVFLVVLLVLNLFVVVVVIKDGDTLNRMLISIAIYAVIYLLAALSMRWLVAGRRRLEEPAERTA